MAQTQLKPHSNLYYPLMALAVIIGVIAGLGILVAIAMNVEGRVRTSAIVFAFPTILLVALVRRVDAMLVRRGAGSAAGTQDGQAAAGSPYPQAGYGTQGADATGYGQVAPGGPQPASAAGYTPTAYGQPGPAQQHVYAQAQAAYGQTSQAHPSPAGWGQPQQSAYGAPGTYESR